MRVMANKLPSAKRVQILSLLCAGMSVRATSRIADVSINTISKLLDDAGEACAKHHHETVRDVKAKRVQCDEIWSFTYANPFVSRVNRRMRMPWRQGSPTDSGAWKMWSL